MEFPIIDVSGLKRLLNEVEKVTRHVEHMKPQLLKAFRTKQCIANTHNCYLINHN